MRSGDEGPVANRTWCGDGIGGKYRSTTCHDSSIAQGLVLDGDNFAGTFRSIIYQYSTTPNSITLFFIALLLPPGNC